MTVRKSSSCATFPSPDLAEFAPLPGQDELDIEMQSIGMQCSREKIKFDDPLNSLTSSPVTVAEWQRALQCALVEKHQLLTLLRKYQQLTRSIKEHGFARYSRALDCSFRRRASTIDPCVKQIGQDIACETDHLAVPDECETGEYIYSTLAINSGTDQKEESSAGQGECSVHAGEEHARRFSSSSSFLYAGVEPTPRPTPVASPMPDSGIEANSSAPLSLSSPAPLSSHPKTSVALSSPLLVDIGRLAVGGWLYKYPRRQYAKLIVQTSIPSSQLNYRYFWLAPHRSALCWSVFPEANELKVAPIIEFYTEYRMIPSEDNSGISGASGEAATASAATVIIVITGKENPLALVPATNEDLGVWMRGLTALLALKRVPDWPHNLSFTCERGESII